LEASGEVKECPSCGSQIAVEATRCEYCKSSLGHCLGCQAWIVEGTQCLDCGKSTAVRVKTARKPEPKVEGYAWKGSGAGLLLPWLLRTAVSLALLPALIAAMAGSGLGWLQRFVAEQVTLPKWGVATFWGIFGGLLVAHAILGRIVRLCRTRHTIVLGKPLEYSPSKIAWVGNLLVAILVISLTGGLGLPWIYARNVRSFYRSCRLQARGGARLEFFGTGEAVLGRFFLTLLLAPLALATLGLAGLVISWMWLSWEQSNLSMPDRNGVLQRVRFRGTFGAFFVRAVGGWLLTLLSLGLYGGWAKKADWEWMAAQTEIP
jgi:hypothetical protein